MHLKKNLWFKESSAHGLTHRVPTTNTDSCIHTKARAGNAQRHQPVMISLSAMSAFCYSCCVCTARYIATGLRPAQCASHRAVLLFPFFLCWVCVHTHLSVSPAISEGNQQLPMSLGSAAHTHCYRQKSCFPHAAPYIRIHKYQICHLRTQENPHRTCILKFRPAPLIPNENGLAERLLLSINHFAFIFYFVKITKYKMNYVIDSRARTMHWSSLISSIKIILWIQT